MKSAPDLPLGALGEQIASRFLSAKGYKILEHNFRLPYGEIDIIAVDRKTLVFVEVKTRVGDRFGTPEEAITAGKLDKLTKAAYSYKLFHKGLPETLRIDAVTVRLSKTHETEKITHYTNISV